MAVPGSFGHINFSRYFDYLKGKYKNQVDNTNIWIREFEARFQKMIGAMSNWYEDFGKFTSLGLA